MSGRLNICVWQGYWQIFHDGVSHLVKLITLLCISLTGFHTSEPVLRTSTKTTNNSIVHIVSQNVEITKFLRSVKACPHLIRIWSTLLTHLNPLHTKLYYSTLIVFALRSSTVMIHTQGPIMVMWWHTCHSLVHSFVSGYISSSILSALARVFA